MFPDKLDIVNNSSGNDKYIEYLSHRCQKAIIGHVTTGKPEGCESRYLVPLHYVIFVKDGLGHIIVM